MFGVMNHLDIAICKDANDAAKQGFTYGDPIKPIEIDKIVVIQNGTEGGNSTVDLVLKDAQGNKFVVMVTGKLLKSIPC